MVVFDKWMRKALGAPAWLWPVLLGGLLAVGGGAVLAYWGMRAPRRNERLFQEMKRGYGDRIKKRLAAWNFELEQLKEKAAGASVSARVGLFRQTELLEGKLSQMESLLRELWHTPEHAWESFRRQLEGSFEGIRSSFRVIRTHLRQSTPPG